MSQLPQPPLWAPLTSSTWLFWFQQLSATVQTTATYNSFLQGLQNGTQAIALPASSGTTPPLQFSYSATLVATPTAGMMETDGANLYFTTTTGRKTVAFSGGAFGPITLPASTTTEAPLTLTQSTVLVSAPVSGMVEYDGDYFYGTDTTGRRPVRLSHAASAVTQSTQDLTTTYTYTNSGTFDVEVFAEGSNSSATWVQFTTATLTRGAVTLNVPISDNSGASGAFAKMSVQLSPGDILALQGVANSGGTPNATISVVPR